MVAILAAVDDGVRHRIDRREIRLDVDQRRAVEAVEADDGERRAFDATSRTTLMAIGFGRTGERIANVPRGSA